MEDQHRIIFLDEPTCGLDPQTKRLIWRAIQNVAQNSTVILTTHSMEEAEEICNRVGIVVAGELRALGTPYQLNEQYGNFYKIKVQGSLQGLERAYLSLRALTSNVASGSATEIGDQDYYRTEILLNETNNLSKYYEALEILEDEEIIEEFSFKFASLDDVFIKIVGAVEPPEETNWELDE